ncbi:precorrin-2 C(20)-methyltransferase [Rhizobium sp. TH2]|uniref:precorrin-2 C(20)-methyltransferase n=1 Tax=Rhizobium sp. TH2 TaxID=2775403 RepID=UPI0021589BE3|nr:precorrin-2 C(20)-methyltransferase [Rhizobium sp. TH2]UVC10983.1 precorrin-2 C(20)-methyltransferase [Rhizobium sp. TH2]
MSGRLIGVGTGPGDPDLLTVKAVKAIQSADVLAWFAKEGRRGNGRGIVDGIVRDGTIELPLYYPVTTEIHRQKPEYVHQVTGFYEASTEMIAAHLDAGRNVAVLSEGDPLFYGSYMHLHVRLANRYSAEVIPGVTAMSGCWSQANLPIVQGDDILSVLPGTLDEDQLVRRLRDTQAAVIMKVGRNLPKIRRALAEAGRINDAFYVERGTMANTAMTPLAAKSDDEAPYFSIVLVPGWKTKP